MTAGDDDALLGLVTSADDRLRVPRRCPLDDAAAGRDRRGPACGSVCVHGDTPGAVALARAVRDALADAGLGPARFVR